MNIPIAIGLLIPIVGPLSSIGIILLIIMIPIIRYYNTLQVQSIKVIRRVSDDRLRLTHEILKSIKAIKLYALHIQFNEMLAKVRQHELQAIAKTQSIKGFQFTLVTSANTLMLLATIVPMACTTSMDASKIFYMYAIFSLVRPIATGFAQAMTKYGECKVALKEIDYLLKSETPVSSIENIQTDLPFDIMLKCSEIGYTSNTDIVMRDINISVPKGSFTAVVGDIASGKSTLLRTMLGLTQFVGTVAMRSQVSYMPQSLWVMNATIKQNILFACSLEQSRYLDTIKCSALARDIASFSLNDGHVVEEGGHNLSGGQKQRLCLARAIYADADVYLFDEPLSALDPQVADYIFNNCFLMYLRHKTRVVISHDPKLLQQCDSIIFMEKGKITALGKYEVLINNTCFRNICGIKDTVIDVNNKNKKLETRRMSVFAQVVTAEDNTSTKEKKNEQISQFELFISFIKASGIMKTVNLFFFVTLYIVAKFGSDRILVDWCSYNYSLSTLQYTIIYSSLMVFQVIAIYMYTNIACSASQQCSKTIHLSIMQSMLSATMSWFDSTPIGAILYCLRNDLYIVDCNVMDSLRRSGVQNLTALGMFVMVCVFNPIFIAFVPLLSIALVKLVHYFEPANKQSKLMDKLLDSKLTEHLIQTNGGMEVILAFRRQASFLIEMRDRISLHNRSIFLAQSARRWLEMRIELYCSLALLVVGLLVIITKDTIQPSIAALSLTYISQISQQIALCLKNWNLFVVEFVSYFRLYTFQVQSIVPQESLLFTVPNKTLALETGSIEFQSLCVSYVGSLKTVLTNITALILDAQKVAIVGRTGSGKSTLISAIFRLIEPCQGKIFIGKINLSHMDLADLRKQLAIVPQEHVVFQGTLRFNLDPFGIHTDQEIDSILSKLELQNFVSSLEDGLQHNCGIENPFSAGINCKIALARSLLKSAKLLVLDEATATLDAASDIVIQACIRKHVSCTVLTIAHRINTIIDYDKIMALQDGKLMEFDSPKVLLNNQGLFFKIFSALDPVTQTQLRQMIK